MLKAAEGREIDFRFVRAPKGKSATNHHSFTLPTQGQPVLWPKPLTASSFAPLLPIPCPLPSALCPLPSALCLFCSRRKKDIGKLDIVWTSSMGDIGRLQTSQLDRPVSG